MEWIFCSIVDRQVIRDNFDCGVPELNEYLKKYAKQNHQKGDNPLALFMPMKKILEAFE